MNLPATILNRNEHMQDLFNNYLMNTEKDYKIVFLYGLENLDRFQLTRELGGSSPMKPDSYLCGNCL